MFFQKMINFGWDLPTKTLRLKEPPQHGGSYGAKHTDYMWRT
jgi:hypothetical protein